MENHILTTRRLSLPALQLGHQGRDALPHFTDDSEAQAGDVTCPRRHTQQRHRGTRTQECSSLPVPLPAPERKAPALCPGIVWATGPNTGPDLRSEPVLGLESWQAYPTGTLPLTPLPVLVPVSHVARDKLRLPQGMPLPGGGLGVGVPTAYFTCHPETQRESRNGGGNRG